MVEVIHAGWNGPQSLAYMNVSGRHAGATHYRDVDGICGVTFYGAWVCVVR